MIIVMKREASQENIQRVVRVLEEYRFRRICPQVNRLQLLASLVTNPC